MGGNYSVNVAIAVIAGGVLGLIGVIGGVAAYQGNPHGVDQVKLYSYADN